MIDLCGPERPRWLCGVLTALREPDVGGVIGANGRCHVGLIEDAFSDREHLICAGAHQHDVDEPLLDVVTNDVSVVVEGTKSPFVRMVFRTFAGGGHASCHIGILRVCEDKIFAVGILKNAGKFGVETLGNQSDGSLK